MQENKAKDPFVEEVRELLKQRSDAGYSKYGKGLDRTDLKPSEWVQHALEEALDMANYLMRLKSDLKGLESLLSKVGTEQVVDKYTNAPSVETNQEIVYFVDKPKKHEHTQCLQGCFFFEHNDCPSDKRGDLICENDKSKIWLKKV